MNRTDLFKSWVAQGVSKDDALAYAAWLQEQKASTLSILRYPVQYAYLNDRADKLSASPTFKPNRLGDIWGLQVEGVFWSRVHTNTLKIDELKIWNDGQIYTMPELLEEHCTEAEKVCWEYFYGCAGSDKITCWIPTVDDFRKLLPHLEIFSAKLAELKAKGHYVEDWFAHEDYWAFDAERKALTVFDVKRGQTKSYDPKEMYATRPVWMPKGVR